MNGLEVFERYAKADQARNRIEERIKRRRALAEGCTSRPLSPTGSGRSSADASMRLVDYMADLEMLEQDLTQLVEQKERDKACCLYLAEGMPEHLGKAMLLRYIDGLPVKLCAEQMNYSVQHYRRLLHDAEEFSRRMELTVWDGNHIPIIAITQ